MLMAEYKIRLSTIDPLTDVELGILSEKIENLWLDALLEKVVEGALNGAEITNLEVVIDW